MKRFVPIAALSLLVSACAFIDTTPEGEQVHFRAPDEIHSCRLVGTTTGSVLAEIAGIPRNRYKVEAELDALARNSAAEMGGDAIVPLGQVEDGRRSFQVYRCRP